MLPFFDGLEVDENHFDRILNSIWKVSLKHMHGTLGVEPTHLQFVDDDVHWDVDEVGSM